MKQVIQYIRDYAKETDKLTVAAITLYTALFVFINYHFGLDEQIRKNSFFAVKLLSWYAVFLCAFGIPYGIQYLLMPSGLTITSTFLFLLLAAPLLFAFKISYGASFSFSTDADANRYWNQVAYWPALLLILFFFLISWWKYRDADQPFYGYKIKGIRWRPYFTLLLLMVPLVLLAAAQPDFRAMYPKLQSITGESGIGAVPVWKKILYELSYGTDFITIETFFRGFLVLGFIKWAGKDAILPMACFYCTIHFGKPLGECISSYFGGILLGILVCHTRSILGGLLVHLGIAWLMEVAGYWRG